MNFVKRFAVICAALLLVSVAVSAQTTSSLTGTVTLDGNPLPGVTVTITSPALLGTRTTVTDVNGNYNFGALPPGDYTVKFEMESMQTVTKQAKVTLSGTGRANADMKLTAIAEAITVTASAPAVLETTEIQTNVQQDLVNQLPIQRTLQAATALAPGVATMSGQGGAAAGAIQISGAPAYDSVFMVNGAAINENLRGQAHNLFIEDAIQETTVLTGAISAEYGRFTGGVVNAITKSGGNEFSGSFRDSLTNDSWTAKGELAPSSRSKTTNPVYEATLGGFILRDRLWFFLAGRHAKRDQQNTLVDIDNTPYIFTDTNKRYEGKLTGQITPKHSLVASYLKVDNPQINNCFGRCLEWSNIDLARELPNDFTSLHYNGILTSALLLEASYSQKNFAFKGSGGDFGDQANGSYGAAFTVAGGEGYFAAPIFCGFCTDEERNNDLWGAKATYYLASKGFGSHNIVGGYEQWSEQRIANNYQSGSNFAVYLYSNLVRPTCKASTPGDPTTVHCHPIIEAGDGIKWAPIFQLTEGSDFQTNSFYVNDKWDLNDHWNFNIGVRYDKNNGTDSSGAKVAKDSAFSPRLGLIYDVLGNGKYRINASYSKYVSRIAETIGSSGAGGGNPSYLYYYYLGDTINANGALNSQQAFAQVFKWFNDNGGVHQKPDHGNVAGIATRIGNDLKSPNVDEYTIGLGSQLTTNAFVRLDFVHKEWNDFYTQILDTTTGKTPAVINDPTAGKVDLGLVDVAEIVNSDFFERKYDAIEVQGAYHPWQRFNLGANYTYSRLRGNVQSETSGSGPVPEAQFRYPEYRSFAEHNPSGPLAGDQPHRLRAWASYDQPTPFGSFNFSLLQRYDSGTPYSAIATIATASFVEDANGCLKSNGYCYEGPDARYNYYFGKRGQYRWDDISSTDLGVTYELPIKQVRLFAQAKMVNIFNNQGQINGETGVLTRRNTTCFQDHGPIDPVTKHHPRCLAFNPFTETPVLGTHYMLGSNGSAQDLGTEPSNFGHGRNPTTSAGANLLAPNGDYQLPRTYLFSFGLRF